MRKIENYMIHTKEYSTKRLHFSTNRHEPSVQKQKTKTK